MLLFGNEETDVNMPISSYGITILMETAYREHTEAVKFLIRRADIGIDLQDEMGITALMRAVFKDNKEIVRILVDAGADVHIPDRNKFFSFRLCSCERQHRNYGNSFK